MDINFDVIPLVDFQLLGSRSGVDSNAARGAGGESDAGHRGALRAALLKQDVSEGYSEKPGWLIVGTTMIRNSVN